MKVLSLSQRSNSLSSLKSLHHDHCNIARKTLLRSQKVKGVQLIPYVLELIQAFISSIESSLHWVFHALSFPCIEFLLASRLVLHLVSPCIVLFPQNASHVPFVHLIIHFCIWAMAQCFTFLYRWEIVFCQISKGNCIQCYSQCPFTTLQIMDPSWKDSTTEDSTTEILHYRKIPLQIKAQRKWSFIRFLWTHMKINRSKTKHETKESSCQHFIIHFEGPIIV